MAKIRQIRANNSDYGAHRIYLELKFFHGYTGSYYVILKLCKKHRLMLKKRHHAKGLTKADLAAQASENLIQQNFSAPSPNQKWLGDITEVPTANGKLYEFDNSRLELAGRPLAEETLLGLGHSYQTVTNWHGLRPKL